MLRIWPLLLALCAVIVGPILLRPAGEAALFKGQDTVVVITPHNEAIRVEFGRGFREWYQAKTGRTVVVDFRTPGGTSEIMRFLNGEFTAAFQNHWKNTLNRPWSDEVARAYLNDKITLPLQPEEDTTAQAARRAFLESNVGTQIDVFFGGGSFDFQRAAAQGLLVDCGYVAARPDLFGEGKPIPPTLGGEPYFDPAGRWMGTAIGAFGIAYNRDQIARIGVPEPSRWADLADPRYFRGLAIANPTQSSSVNKAFEMLIQQQMNIAVAAAKQEGHDEAHGIENGWRNAMRLIQRLGANARYWTDSSAKISLDVEAGEAAAGMTIDFYGRYQSEAVRRADGSSRIGYVNAEGGTSFGVDPIGKLRGAKRAAVADAFIEYVMGPGQKIWGWKKGAPGGPRDHALRRLPILPELYEDHYRELRSDPEVLPYLQAKDFTYVEARTGRLFSASAFIIRVMCIDTHSELVAAWRELNAAKERLGQYPPQALAVFEDVSRVEYQAARGPIRDATASSASKLAQVQLAKELAGFFRTNYRRAAELAVQGL